MRTVGVVPAAGYATRLGPIPQSKEVIPVDGRPAMDYLLDRLDHAPCDDVRVVTRPEKADVIAHAQSRGARVITGHPAHVSESLLLGIADLPDDAEVLFGFPDSIWEPPDGFARLLAALRRPGTEIALGLFRTNEPERSDVVTLEAERVKGIAVKPARPATSWIWGCCATSARVLRGLREVPEPGVYFDGFCARGVVAGIALSDVWIDIGTQEALAAVRREGRRPGLAVFDAARFDP